MGDKRILQRLENVRKQGKGYVACCPAHQDRSPSLSLYFHDDGRILMHCFAGCETSDVLAAIGLTMSELFPEPIAHYLPGGDKRARQNSAQKKTYKDRVLLELCESKRKRGEKLTPDELKQEREAYMRVRHQKEELGVI